MYTTVIVLMKKKSNRVRNNEIRKKQKFDYVIDASELIGLIDVVKSGFGQLENSMVVGFVAFNFEIGNH